MNSAFYNIYKSYEENYRLGPPFKQKLEKNKTEFKKNYKFLGFEVNTPFGIPAGPLLNGKFIKLAFNLGFDVSTYKTVRSCSYPCHPYPNVLFINTEKNLHPEKTPILTTIEKPTSFSGLNITNSFGVPSTDPKSWQKDVRKTLKYVKKGQLLILSFMGTVKKGQTQDEFIEDFALCAKLAKDTKAKVLEVNLSCPNIGNEGLVCYDLETTKKVCKAIRNKIGNTPLIIKIGYFKNESELALLAKIANEYANAIAAINTIAAQVVDKNGNQALPGENRVKSGVCGGSIKWAGLEMVKRLNNIRQENNYKFEIIGVGGVMAADDYLEYKKAGANLVQSATGAMWNPNLANEIKKKI